MIAVRSTYHSRRECNARLGFDVNIKRVLFFPARMARNWELSKIGSMHGTSLKHPSEMNILADTNER